MGYFDEEEARGALGGAASGAMTGAAVGSLVPGIGTGIGAAAGGLLGGIGGFFSGKGQKKQNQAMGEARKRMQELARQQLAQRQANLERALGYFRPVNDFMTSGQTPFTHELPVQGARRVRGPAGVG